MIKRYNFGWNVTALISSVNVRVFNNFADFIFIYVLQTSN